MLPSLLSVDFARWQFGLTASFHFLFVPLTLGLTWILFTMELMYVRTGKQVYKDMVKFWGKLLGINFALGVLTGLTMEFEFGTNWAYYSQSVGDIFGTPLAIEGMVAFMLESSFVGLFFFGWDRLTKRQHLCATMCLAIGSSLSALLILVANGFMQHPAGGMFSADTMRMETTNLGSLFLNDMGQVGFAHTVVAGYVTAAIFVAAISCFYLLRGRDVGFAKRSLGVSVGFGFIATLMVIYLGDANGVSTFQTQPMKLAAIEAEWDTAEPPANFNLIAFPDQEKQTNYVDIDLPNVLGVLITHNNQAKVPGLKAILYGEKGQNTGKRNPNVAYYVDENGMTATVSQKTIDNNPGEYKAVPSMVTRIQQGALAYADLLDWRHNGHPGDKPDANQYPDYAKYQSDDMGYGMLLAQAAHAKYPNQPLADAIRQAAQDKTLIKSVAEDSVPTVWMIFWAFRVMVGFGFLMFFAMLVGVFLVARNKAWKHRWWQWWVFLLLPAPWISVLCGWFVTEHGRQPFTVYGTLPTSLSSSSLTSGDVATSLAIFVLLDLSLYAVMLFLMFRFARLGPSSLGTGRYHFEKNSKGNK